MTRKSALGVLALPMKGLKCRSYKNQSSLFYLVPGGKELMQDGAGLSQDAAPKATTFLETT